MNLDDSIEKISKKESLKSFDGITNCVLFGYSIGHMQNDMIISIYFF